MSSNEDFRRLQDDAQCVKNLGIYFDRTLSFCEHIHNIVSDSNKALGFMLQTCSKFNSISSSTAVYNAFVRAKLEYGSIICIIIYIKYI